MNDNVRRMLRTGLQALAGVLATGALNALWENYSTNHDPLDPTLALGITIVITAITAWAQNAIEDRTGKGILVPQDRLDGDVVLDQGIGVKQATAAPYEYIDS
jgi:hypothetical protein